jgi:hypothetical protein
MRHFLNARPNALKPQFRKPPVGEFIPDFHVLAPFFGADSCCISRRQPYLKTQKAELAAQIKETPEMSALYKAVFPAIWYSFASASVARLVAIGAFSSRKADYTGTCNRNQPMAVMAY